MEDGLLGAGFKPANPRTVRTIRMRDCRKLKLNRDRDGIKEMMKSLFNLGPDDSQHALARHRVRPSLLLIIAVALWTWLPTDFNERYPKDAAPIQPAILETAARALKKPWRPGWRVHARTVVSALRFVLDLDGPARPFPPNLGSPPSLSVWALSTNQPGETPAI